MRGKREYSKKREKREKRKKGERRKEKCHTDPILMLAEITT